MTHELPRPLLGDRALFPELEARAYLNHAAISPPSLLVRAAVEAVLGDYQRRGVAAFSTWFEQRDRLRGKLAQLIGATEQDLGFVANTTRGVTDIALCFPWEPGDRVVVFDGEFPANVTPWQRAAELFELEVVTLKISDFDASHEQGLGSLREALERGARLVAVSAVQFQTGLRMPLREIAELCHAHGAQVFVDAIQACGVVPLDVAHMGIDYLSCGSHKWLMGMEGVAFVYAAPGRAAELRPHVAGWLSHEEGLRFLFEGEGHLRYDRPIKKGIGFLEGGAYNGMGCAALEASVDPITSIGVEAIHEHVNTYNDALEEGLRQRDFTSLRSPDPARRSGSLSVIPPPGISLLDLYGQLGPRGVSCSTPDGRLRFAPQWPNHVDEVPFVLDAIDRSLALIR